jgi:hypothetical protein
MFYNCYSLTIIPLINTSKGTDFSNMFQYCYSLTSIPELNTNKSTNNGTIFGDCKSLRIATLSGTSANIGYLNCLLSATELVNIFNKLATVSGKTITITGCWGAHLLTLEQRTIATDKGWTLTG